VDPEYGPKAYQTHAEFTATNQAVLPRTREQFLGLVSEGLVWAAIDEDQLAGLCYSRFVPDKNEWEIGGLMVLERAREKGIGSVLMLLTLGHLLFYQDPLAAEPRPTILAHVLKRNPMPRGIIENALKFHLAKSDKFSPEGLEGLPVEEDGFVHGDEYHISIPESLRALAAFADQWSNKLPKGHEAEVEMFEGTTLRLWAEAFREMEETLVSRRNVQAI